MEKRTILHIYTDSPSFQTIAKIIITYKISKTGKLLQLLSRETDLEPVTRATLRTAAAPGVSSEGGNTFLQHDLRSYMGELKYLQFRCYFKNQKKKIETKLYRTTTPSCCISRNSFPSMERALNCQV